MSLTLPRCNDGRGDAAAAEGFGGQRDEQGRVLITGANCRGGFSWTEFWAGIMLNPFRCLGLGFFFSFGKQHKFWDCPMGLLPLI